MSIPNISSSIRSNHTNLFAVLFRFLCLFSRLVQTTYQIDYNTIEFRRNVCFFLLLVKYHLCLVYFEKLNFSGKNNGLLYFRWFGKTNLMVTFGCNRLIRFIFHCLCNFSSFRETCMYTSYPWRIPIPSYFVIFAFPVLSAFQTETLLFSQMCLKIKMFAFSFFKRLYCWNWINENWMSDVGFQKLSSRFGSA